MSAKEAYVEKVQAQLDQWNADLKKLKAKADEAEADAKIQIQNEIEKVEAKQAETREQLQKLRSASDDAFEDMKAGFESAWGSMSKAMTDAMNRFR